MPPKVTRTSQNETPEPKTGKYRSAWSTSNNIKMLLYGKSGTGKTTLWATFPKPITALICSGGNEPGELRSIDTPEYRKSINPIILDRGTDVREAVADAAVEGVKTLVLDHVSGLQDMVLCDILGIDRIPVQKGWGLASQQQYGQCAQICKDILRDVLSLKCNVVIVGQERVFGGEDSALSDIIRPSVGVGVMPSLAQWLNPSCDYVVQTYLSPRMREVKSEVNGQVESVWERVSGVDYCLRTEPHDVYMTKFRVPLGRELPSQIHNPTYTKLMKVIRGE